MTENWPEFLHNSRASLVESCYFILLQMGEPIGVFVLFLRSATSLA